MDPMVKKLVKQAKQILVTDPSDLSRSEYRNLRASARRCAETLMEVDELTSDLREIVADLQEVARG